MTKSMRSLRTLPLPLRVGALSFLVVFPIAFIGLISSSGQRSAVAFSIGLLGVDGFLLGMILASDYRGSASAYAGLWSVAAGSWPRIFVRVFGVGLMVVGALFVAVSAILAFVHTS
jgi:hypothetical protein